MQRLQPITRLPAAGETVPPEVKLTFARDVIDVAIPLFTNKNPQNPTGTGTTTL